MENLTQQNLLHPLPAGIMPGDLSTELFGDRQNRKVNFLSNGAVKPFKELPQLMRVQIEKWLLKDKKAQEDLSGLTWSAALEEYAYCLFGSADSSPDFCSKGRIQKPDNFRCGEQCRCLNWERKNIAFNEVNLTVRELQVLDQLKTGKPSKVIVGDLGIELSTLNTHKKNIMIKLGAQNTTETVFKAGVKKIIQ